jgi:hypothetical protein
MQTVKGFIASKQRELDAHPLLDQVRRDEPGVLVRLAPQLAFRRMVLRDVVRKTEPLVTAFGLKPIARELRLRVLGREGRYERDIPANCALSPEAIRAPNDACRVAVLLSVASASRALDLPGEEWAPAVLHDEADAYLSALELPAAARQQAIALVDRCYRALTAMLDDLERSLVASSSPASIAAFALARTVLAPVA